MERNMPRMAALVLAASLGPLGAIAQPATPASDALPPPDPWSSTEIVAPRMDPRPLPRNETKAPAAAANPKSLMDPDGSGWRTAAALGGVVGLILLLAWGYRAVANGGGRWPRALRGKHSALIEIISRTALSPRQALCLVRIGPRLVLLGVTPDAVRTLDVVQDADLVARLLGQTARARPDSHSAEFASCLEREAVAAERSPERLNEPAPPDDRTLAELRQRLTGTLARLRAAATKT
jgi:flagellar biogenesis protein FliO